jgi:serine protease inhibitor
MAKLNGLRLLGMVGLAAGLAGCGGNNEASNNYLPMTRKNVTPEAVDRATKSLTAGKAAKIPQASNEFGFKLFGELVKADANRNVFVSPASVSMCLAMVENGAAGQTKDAMDKSLGLAGLLPNEMNQAYKDMRTLLLSPDPKVTLNIANAIWANQGTEFKREFIGRNTDYFGAKVTAANLKNPEVVNDINSWVKEATEDMIPKLFEALPANPEMVLVNAIYFKGDWQVPFDKKATSEKPFTAFDGKAKNVQMMSKIEEWGYFQDKRFAAVQLPYGSGRVGMQIYLPNKDVKFADFAKDLNAKNWQTWQTKFKVKEGTVQIPRFKSDYDKTLNDALKELGMGVAFDPDKADFSNMTAQKGLWLSTVIHKTVIDVTEEGTEAAAATGAVMETKASPVPQERFTFTADRPFFYAIVDKDTSTILFMGVYGQP